MFDAHTGSGHLNKILICPSCISQSDVEMTGGVGTSYIIWSQEVTVEA